MIEMNVKTKEASILDIKILILLILWILSF